MSAIYGIEESDAQGFLSRNIVCLPHTSNVKHDLHFIISAIKSDDIVFIKHSTSQPGLQIKAVGIVRSDFPVESEAEVCLPVEWVWRGEKVLKSFDEELFVRGDPFYEEHDILVQREVINMLPEKYQMPQEW